MASMNASGGNATPAGTASKDMYRVAPTPERLMRNERVLIVTADNTHDLEFFYPYYRLSEEGYQVDVATPSGAAFKAEHGMGLQQTQAIASVRAEDYALLYIPGGKAPQTLRKDEATLSLVRALCSAGKPVAAICHGPQVLISADLVKGKQLACAPDVQPELEQAGATYVNEALVEDGQFITARQPGDLPRHLYGVLDYLQGREGSQKGRRTPQAA